MSYHDRLFLFLTILARLFTEVVIFIAILDRLLHHCRVVNIKGHSYRLRKHQIGQTGVPKAD